MSLVEFTKHVEWIEGRVRVALHHFWVSQDDDIVDGVIRDWIDQLEQFSQDTIQAAFFEYLGRDTGVKPKPGQIKAMCSKIVWNAS